MHKQTQKEVGHTPTKVSIRLLSPNETGLLYQLLSYLATNLREEFCFMDYREELLNKIMLMLYESGIDENLDKIKNILVRAIGDYEITERCTDIAVVDNNNIQLIKLFLADKKITGGSNETFKTRWYVLKKFEEFICRPLIDVNTFELLRWLSEIQKHVSLSTAESYRSIIYSFYSWMLKKKYIKENPMDDVQPIKHPDPIKTSFSPVEVDAIKCACRTKLDRAMVELLLSSGLRCEELCNLKWKDVDFNTNYIMVIEGKGRKNRITFMDDVTNKYLLEYKNSLNYYSEYVFGVKYRGEIKARTTDSVWRKLKDIGERAKVHNVYPHRFRRTMASLLYQRGLEIHQIQQLLGHSSPNVTTRYLSVNTDMLMNAYKKCI